MFLATKAAAAVVVFTGLDQRRGDMPLSGRHPKALSDYERRVVEEMDGS
jgi:hypothetical protein